jgi:hypothetical protein
MWKVLAFIALIFASRTAEACQCKIFPEQAASGSKISFVFQVVSTELYPGRRDDPTDDGAVARIRIVQVLRGKPIATHISYSVSWCCGLAMTAGSYYVAFLQNNPRSFTADFDNILALNPLYQPSQKVPSGISEMLRSGRPPADFISESQSLLSRIPAPPCPPRQVKNGR